MNEEEIREINKANRESLITLLNEASEDAIVCAVIIDQSATSTAYGNESLTHWKLAIANLELLKISIAERIRNSMEVSVTSQ